MSQQKVDRYKKEKANRAKELKKQKRRHTINVLLGTVIACFCVGFIIWSGVRKWAPQPETTTAKYVSQIDADSLRQTLIQQGVITTTADENATTTEAATTTKAK